MKAPHGAGGPTGAGRTAVCRTMCRRRTADGLLSRPDACHIRTVSPAPVRAAEPFFTWR